MIKNSEAEAFFSTLSAHDEVATALSNALKRLGAYELRRAAGEYGAIYATTAGLVFCGAAGMSNTYWRLRPDDLKIAIATGAEPAPLVRIGSKSNCSAKIGLSLISNTGRCGHMISRGPASKNKVRPNSRNIATEARWTSHPTPKETCHENAQEVSRLRVRRSPRRPHPGTDPRRLRHRRRLPRLTQEALRGREAGGSQ